LVSERGGYVAKVATYLSIPLLHPPGVAVQSDRQRSAVLRARPGACVPQVMNPEVPDAGAQDVEQQLAVDYDGRFSGL
jgi:hypothetical protein